MGFSAGSVSKELTCSVGDWGLIPGLERYPLQHSFLAGESPWTEEPRRLQSVGSEEQEATEQLSKAHRGSYYVSTDSEIYLGNLLFIFHQVSV